MEKSSGALIIREFVQHIDRFRTQNMLAFVKPEVTTSVRQDCKGKTMITFPYNRIEEHEP